MKEIKNLNKWGDISHSWIGRLILRRLFFLTWSIDQAKISIKISASYFMYTKTLYESLYRETK